jgi:F0F1-type ATP synthase membrane subunit b/b'
LVVGCRENIVLATDSMTDETERMFAQVRQSLKAERERIVNKVKDDIQSAKNKALTRIR